MIKRAFDIVFSIVFLIPVIVLGLVLLVLNRRHNPGRLLTFQPRVGRNGKVFRVAKFRTMVGGTRNDTFAGQEVDRIRPLGAWLRRRRIDELPQIYNVLRGEMSVIGPRPEQPGIAQKYSDTIPNYSQRHAVRPGITGLAQVEIGYTSDVSGATGKLRYDLSYLRRSNLALEWQIIRRTAVLMLHGFGDR